MKRTKLLRNGEAPIFVRITVDALREEMSIQRSINLSDWIEKKCCAKPTNAKNRELIHFPQPVQFSLFWIMICLCHKKVIFPITCFGQASTHCQHAVQQRKFVLMQAVKFFCFIF
jgi:hypothetical protein